MRITPLDIRKQPFRKQVMGFDKDEVNSFLEMVANEFEQLIRAHDDISSRLKVLQERLERYEKIEKTLNETLLSAQRASDEARLNAQKESDLLLREAQVKADKYIDQSKHVVHQLESELLSLRTQRDSFLLRFKSMLRDQLSLLQILSDNLSDAQLQKTSAPVSSSRGEAKNHLQIQQTSIDEETLEEIPPEPVV